MPRKKAEEKSLPILPERVSLKGAVRILTRDKPNANIDDQSLILQALCEAIKKETLPASIVYEIQRNRGASWVFDGERPSRPAYTQTNRPDINKTSLAVADLLSWAGMLPAQAKGNEEKTGELNPKSKKTLLAMVLAMAVDLYGYDITDPKSPIPSEISKAIEDKLMDVTVTPQTVRDWLKEAGREFRVKETMKGRTKKT